MTALTLLMLGRRLCLKDRGFFFVALDAAAARSVPGVRHVAARAALVVERRRSRSIREVASFFVAFLARTHELLDRRVRRVAFCAVGVPFGDVRTASPHLDFVAAPADSTAGHDFGLHGRGVRETGRTGTRRERFLWHRPMRLMAELAVDAAVQHLAGDEQLGARAVILAGPRERARVRVTAAAFHHCQPIISRLSEHEVVAGGARFAVRRHVVQAIRRVAALARFAGA
jgi:hypothetical protein